MNRTLSPTAINTYLSCPRKFYFRYIEKRKSRPSIHLIRGQIVHRTLHEFHKNHPKLMPATPISAIREELIATFNRLWDHAGDQLRALNLDEEELESFRTESERMLFNFSHWLLKNELKVPDFSELRLFSKNLRLLGIIDAVHQTCRSTHPGGLQNFQKCDRHRRHDTASCDFMRCFIRTSSTRYQMPF